MVRRRVKFMPRTTPRTRRARSSATTWCRRRWSTPAAQLIGRLTVNAVVDYIREASDERTLAEAGLREEEDIFASVLDSVQEPLGVAGDQPGHGVHRLARHRPVRGLDRAAGGARGADADRRRHRRQFRQPDHHDDRARARARPDPRAATGRSCWKELGVALLNGVVWGSAARRRRLRCSTATSRSAA